MGVSEVDALLGPDLGPFQALLQHLLSPSNADRGAAEKLFNKCREDQPDATTLKLVASLQPSCPSEIRTIAAVLLRRLLTKESVSVWSRLGPVTQQQVKTGLLAALEGETEKSIWKKLCDTTADLASGIVEAGEWPDLLPFMFRAVTASSGPPTADARLKEIALLIFSQLVHFLQQPLRPYAGDLHSVFALCLSPASPPDVRMAALRASVNFVEAVETAQEVAQMQDLLPGMMQVLTMALNAGDEASGQEALELLVEVAELEPRFLRKQLGEVVTAMLQIAESPKLEDATRHLAVELLISLAEARERAPGMMRKVPHLVGRLFEVLLGMLTDIEDVPEWHAADREEDEDAGESDNYGMAQECLDRLAIAVGGNTVLSVASQALPGFVTDPDWKKRHAAVICLAQIAEGCSKVMVKSMDSVVVLLSAGFNDPSPRVRWAAINAVGQLCTDLSEVLPEQYHQQVMPALLAAMDDTANPRVQAHATAALLNFSDAASPDIMAPYMDALLTKLLQLLQHPRRIVQEGALTAVAAVADCAQDQFVLYYDTVMPYLKAILVGANSKDQRLLRSKAMECISLVGMAVGKDKFRDDARQVMEVLLQLQQQQQQQQQQQKQDGGEGDADDPTMSYMLQAWARLCKCLGQEFLPYMPIVMPPLLHSASLKPDVTILDVEEDDAEDEDEDGVETITIGDKRIGIRTSMLEEKATACSMLCCYAEELKDGFLPWIQEVAHLMVPLIKFYFHEEVRKAAVQSIPELLRDGKLAMEKGMTPPPQPGQPLSYVKGLLALMLPPLIEAVPKEPDVEMTIIMLESLQETIQVAGRELDAGEVQSILGRLQEVQKSSTDRRQERSERSKTEDFDEEEQEALEEENDMEDQVLDGIGECIGELIRVFQADFDSFFASMAQAVLQMMDKKNSVTERRVGLCIFDDAAENMGDAAWKYFSTFVPPLLESCHDSSPEIRQAAVYGVGVCAQHGGSAFTPFVHDAVARVGALVSAPDARSEDNVGATDNAVSALGKLCQYQAAAGFDTTSVLSVWLSYLPIKDDKSEAKAVHAHLSQLLHQSDARILGPANQNLPRIAALLVEILAGGAELASDETRQQLLSILRTVPSPALAGVPAEHHALLQSLLSSH